MLIKPVDESEKDKEVVPLVSAVPELAGKEQNVVHAGPIEAALARASPTARRVFGFVLAILAGLCYGSNFDPPMVRCKRRSLSSHCPIMLDHHVKDQSRGRGRQPGRH